MSPQVRTEHTYTDENSGFPVLADIDGSKMSIDPVFCFFVFLIKMSLSMQVSSGDIFSIGRAGYRIPHFQGKNSSYFIQ